MRVELRDIRKYFGAVKANDGISLTLEPVSYTHLDVYKRQECDQLLASNLTANIVYERHTLNYTQIGRNIVLSSLL